MPRKTRRIFWKLNKEQVNRLSDFMANLSLLVLASFVFPQLTGIDKKDPFVLISGLITALIVLLFSLFLLRRRKNE